MVDISPRFSAIQRQTLKGCSADYVVADFAQLDRSYLARRDLALLNENLGDFPTLVEIPKAIFHQSGLEPLDRPRRVPFPAPQRGHTLLGGQWRPPGRSHCVTTARLPNRHWARCSSTHPADPGRTVLFWGRGRLRTCRSSPAEASTLRCSTGEKPKS
jgi:hypothetical protein